MVGMLYRWPSSSRWPRQSVAALPTLSAPSPLPLLWLVVLALAWIAWLLTQPRRLAHRRRRLQLAPFPEAWERILRRRVPMTRSMPADLLAQLKGHIQVFVAEKAFIGCEGQRITDDVRITVAAQACLLLLNRPTDYYPRLRQILVYPRAFWVPHTQPDEHGLVHADDELRAGESWDEGQVILAWDEARDGARIPDDAFNVVLHEFAHQLDAENGLSNGAPELGSPQRHARWAEVMQAAFAELQVQVARGEETVLDPYGASEPVEFFAVATEAFFERGQDLKQTQPALYAELAGFYQVDPAGW